jgi:hypothetical protein
MPKQHSVLLHRKKTFGWLGCVCTLSKLFCLPQRTMHHMCPFQGYKIRIYVEVSEALRCQSVHAGMAELHEEPRISQAHQHLIKRPSKETTPSAAMCSGVSDDSLLTDICARSTLLGRLQVRLRHFTQYLWCDISRKKPHVRRSRS